MKWWTGSYLQLRIYTKVRRTLIAFQSWPACQRSAQEGTPCSLSTHSGALPTQRFWQWLSHTWKVLFPTQSHLNHQEHESLRILDLTKCLHHPSVFLESMGKGWNQEFPQSFSSRLCSLNPLLDLLFIISNLCYSSMTELTLQIYFEYLLWAYTSSMHCGISKQK